MGSGTREALEYRERRNRTSFYKVLGAVGETGRDRGRHGVVVPLWYESYAVHMQNRVEQQRVLVNLVQYITSKQLRRSQVSFVQ
jgi:hypothetical protein